MGWVVVLLELVDILGGVLHGGEVLVHNRHLGSDGAASVLVLSWLTRASTWVLNVSSSIITFRAHLGYNISEINLQGCDKISG